jgi:lysophospholipase L1-like esterase
MARGWGIVVALLLSVPPAVAQPPDPSQWESDIRAFEAADAARKPPAGAVLFIGSSSIRLWSTLETDFPGVPVINRGFGGSQLPDVAAYVDRIVTPYQPRKVIVYCGANDIDAGRSAAEVLAGYQTLVQAIHARLPATPIAFIAVAPNPARWAQIETVREANRLVAEWSATDRRLSFIDVHQAMLGPDGTPMPGIFVDDKLHMNEKGYAIWRAVVGPHLK